MQFPSLLNSFPWFFRQFQVSQTNLHRLWFYHEEMYIDFQKGSNKHLWHFSVDKIFKNASFRFKKSFYKITLWLINHVGCLRNVFANTDIKKRIQTPREEPNFETKILFSYNIICYIFNTFMYPMYPQYFKFRECFKVQSFKLS